MQSNKLGLAAFFALTGFAAMANVVGCGGDGPATSTSSGGPKCGNAVVEGDEACDDGNDQSGDGCEVDCSFSCDNSTPETGNVKCDDGNICNGPETCSDDHVCVNGMNQVDGFGCDTGKICIAGACQEDICGDGFVNPMEECDDGNMVDGDGCDSCKFSCKSDDPTRNCSNLDPCVATGCDDATHTCGNPISAGDVCGLSSVCVNGACSPIACGNTMVEAGEECDDGNMVDGDGCQSDCTLPPAGCGNGMRESGEQCDDNNKTNLDGCDSSCKFEQVQRATWLQMQFGTEEPFCPANALGGSIATLAQGQIQSSLDSSVQNGSIDIMFKTLGLNDLSGTSDPFVEVGFLSGTPVIPAGTMYDGTKDLDWWHTISAASIDANRNPLEKLAGYISGKTLYAGPGKVSIGINFAGVPAKLNMSNAQIMASIGDASKPTVSSGTTPGHLASANLDPALQSYATMATPDATGGGQLCGYVGANSLSQVPVPAALTMGMLACQQGYTAQNSLLDVIVGGCTLFGVATVIVATQPDQADPNAPVAGAGAPYKLTANASTKKVEGCRDKNDQMVDLNACRTAAAYSAFFKFATNRVIGK